MAKCCVSRLFSLCLLQFGLIIGVYTAAGKYLSLIHIFQLRQGGENSNKQSAGKIMATVFWDQKGVLLIDFMPTGTTINADAYCETPVSYTHLDVYKRQPLVSIPLLRF